MYNFEYLANQELTNETIKILVNNRYFDNIENWNVTKITDMSKLFYKCNNF